MLLRTLWTAALRQIVSFVGKRCGGFVDNPFKALLGRVLKYYEVVWVGRVPDTHVKLYIHYRSTTSAALRLQPWSEPEKFGSLDLRRRSWVECWSSLR